MFARVWTFFTIMCLAGTMACLSGKDLRLFPVPEERSEIPQWDMTILRKPPRIYDVGLPNLNPEPGMRAIYFEGLPYQGKPTRVFAWLGIPRDRGDVRLPGIILVHGAGGTAYHDWVKLWVERGYAAIAIDTTGCVPDSTQGMGVKYHRHEHAGPGFGGGGFSASMEPVSDQWLYHAVADTILAYSLLASLPEVDPDRIGITGISWGGIITEICVGVDERFCFAAPVYGCGHLGENSYWLETIFQELPSEKVEHWISLWDPSQYLGSAKMPLLFCNGTNDKHFRPDSWRKTYREAAGPVSLSMKIRMPHAHPPAGDPPEITRFADSIVQDGPPLARVTEQGVWGDKAWVRWEQDVPVKSVELVYTTDDGNWVQRDWMSRPAKLDSFGRKAEASIPAGTTVYFFNLKDEKGCVVSSEYVEPES